MECPKHKGVKAEPIFEGAGWSRKFVGYDCPECKKEKGTKGDRAEFSSGNGWGRN